jgi:signal transduction histidine kinase
MDGIRSTRSTLSRLTLAVVSVAIALVLSLWLEPVLDATTVFVVAVVVVAWFAGLVPGLLAVFLATIAVDYAFTPPLYSFKFGIDHAPRVVLFALLAGFIASASAARRRAEDLLRHARDELDVRVRERTADLTHANERLEELAGRLINAQEEERSRIGRELHDHISQRLGILAIKIDQARADMPHPQGSVGDALRDLRQHTSEITGDVHRLSHRLHSSMLDHLGLVPALQKLVEEIAQSHALKIDFVHTPVPASLPPDVALCLFRIAEESLNNVATHSGARAARVEVARDADGVRLTVDDSGVGFDPATVEGRAGLGFVSMRERLRLIHGTLQVRSDGSQGTRIEAWVPVRA